MSKTIRYPALSDSGLIKPDMKKTIVTAAALFMTCALMVAGGVAHASAEKTGKADEKQQSANCDAQRYIKLNALEYTSPEKWELWINDYKITSAGVTKSEGFPKELMEVLVIDANNVKIRWYDKCLDKAIGHTFNPGQTYWIVPGLIVPGEAAATEIPLPQVAADTPLEQAGMTDEALILWAEIAASETMTFDYKNHQKQLQQASKYFTEAGWHALTKEIQKMRVLESIEANERAVSSYSRSTQELQKLKNSCILGKTKAQQGSIVESNPQQGRYTVKISVALIMTVCEASKKNTKGYNVILTIQKVPSAENVSGLAIIDWQPLEHNPSKKDEKP